jgi:hypothetical protein
VGNAKQRNMPQEINRRFCAELARYQILHTYRHTNTQTNEHEQVTGQLHDPRIQKSLQTVCQEKKGKYKPTCGRTVALGTFRGLATPVNAKGCFVCIERNIKCKS